MKSVSQKCLQALAIVMACGVMILSSTPVFAQVKLPNVFGEHMVLQRDKPIKIWGTAPAGTKVNVKLADNSTEVTTSPAGKWMATMPAMKAGGPYPLTVAEDDQPPVVNWKDILIGEVWLCSGQSNMQWSVAASANAEQEIASANYPMIRHLGVKRDQSARPLDDFEASWKVCNPQNVAQFTAVGYYFGRKLNQDLNIPIGLLHSSWGGTRVEPWTPPTGFEMVPALANINQEVKMWSPGTPENRAGFQKHIADVEAWLNMARKATSSEGEFNVGPSPAFPSMLTPPTSHQSPTKLYNYMIHPLVGLPMRGAIWYQGESNHTEGMLYFEKKKALIQGWRKLWGQGDFPFYFVQIAPYHYGKEDPTVLPIFWEAQARVTSLPNTGMVVVSDIGNIRDIHPRNKQDVGARLAAFALKNDYGLDRVAGSPVATSVEFQPEQVKITFTNVGDGLMTIDGKKLTHFEIAGRSTGFQPATATLKGDQVILTSDQVKQPLAMRFAWDKLAAPNLANSAGNPVAAFRAGKLPSPVQIVPGFDDYQLVYDFDFSKIGSEFAYQQDNHRSIKNFERVAYCLEYEQGGDTQFIFVSMKAFTDDASQIGIPTFASKANFQQAVQSMDVYSNVPGIKQGKNLTGHIEFWPNNYGQQNSANVKGASSSTFDFGDQPSEPVNGYGSMQVHLPSSRQTLFSVNHWNAGPNMELGIGNAPSGNPDWTFSKNFSSYATPRLRVLVR